MRRDIILQISNQSSKDIQDLVLQNGEKMYIHVAKLIPSQQNENIWFVVGDTRS